MTIIALIISILALLCSITFLVIVNIQTRRLRKLTELARERILAKIKDNELHKKVPDKPYDDLVYRRKLKK